MRQWPVAQQRLVGVRQDHSLGVGIVLDRFPELLGLLEPPAHGVLAARAPQLVEIHGHATLAALHPLDHRLIAGLPLEADRHRPGFEYVLQRSEVLGLGGDRQGLGDLFDEALLVGGPHVTQQLGGVGGSSKWSPSTRAATLMPASRCLFDARGSRSLLKLADPDRLAVHAVVR
jgi:hypothetical protein